MTEKTEVALFSRHANERLLSEMNTKDGVAVNLGDTLDVKASILLALIVFLATQTAYFLEGSPAGFLRFLLFSSAVLLGAATACSFLELWPREYFLLSPEKILSDRVVELRDFYSANEGFSGEEMIQELTENEVEWARKRISCNQKINRRKSFWLWLSFGLAALAMIFNTAILFTRLF